MSELEEQSFDKLSAPLQLLTILWRGTNRATGHSWRRLNTSMDRGTRLAIEAGMRFKVDDFKYVSGHFQWGWWAGNDSGFAEQYYTLAVQESNYSACVALEAYFGRKPFIADYYTRQELQWHHPSPYGGHIRGRLCVGAEFPWDGRQVKVTSFADKGKYLTAVTYKPRSEGTYKPTQIARRYTITVTDLRVAHRNELGQQKEQAS